MLTDPEVIQRLMAEETPCGLAWAARALGRHPGTVRSLIVKNKLEGWHVGGSRGWRTTRQAVARYAAAVTAGHAPRPFPAAPRGAEERPRQSVREILKGKRG